MAVQLLMETVELQLVVVAQVGQAVMALVVQAMVAVEVHHLLLLLL